MKILNYTKEQIKEVKKSPIILPCWHNTIDLVLLNFFPVLCILLRNQLFEV